MNTIYDKVKNQPKTKNDSKLLIIIIVAIIFSIFILYPIVRSILYTVSFNNFIDSFKESALYARENESYEIKYNDELVSDNPEYVSYVLQSLLAMGMGTECDDIEADESITISFGNGSELVLKPTTSIDENGREQQSMFMDYQYPNGKTYRYKRDYLYFDVYRSYLIGY